MSAYIVSYKRYPDDFTSTNIVWADDYSKVSLEFDRCYWFAAHIAPEWEVKAARNKGMPERWLGDKIIDMQ